MVGDSILVTDYIVNMHSNYLCVVGNNMTDRATLYYMQLISAISPQIKNEVNKVAFSGLLWNTKMILQNLTKVPALCFYLVVKGVH